MEIPGCFPSCLPIYPYTVTHQTSQSNYPKADARIVLGKARCSEEHGSLQLQLVSRCFSGTCCTRQAHAERLEAKDVLELRMAWTHGFQTLFSRYLTEFYRTLTYNFQNLAEASLSKKPLELGPAPSPHLCLPWHQRHLCTEDNLEHDLKVTGFWKWDLESFHQFNNFKTIFVNVRQS